jgi:anthranilate synthase component 2
MIKRILVIDNYDSFTYNLVQYISEIKDTEVTVMTNDDNRLGDVAGYDALIISPGPGIPDEAGKMKSVFKKNDLPPTLGVCLGHQAIAEAFGGSISQLEKVYHGVASKIAILKREEKLFDGVDEIFEAGRYHSWVVNPESLNNTPLEVICRDDENTIMGIRHRERDILGVQFHPESVLTPEGRMIILNFIKHYVA